MAQNAPPIVLSANAFEKIAPAAYHRRFFARNLRPDSRHFSDFRGTSVQINSVTTAYGSAVVRMGSTMVICGIKGEVAQPDVNFPDRGYFVPNIELSPVASTDFSPGTPSELAQVLSYRLDQVVREGGLLDLTQLCIEEKAAVWTLYADVTVLAYDGNVFDAALLALQTALLYTKLPRAQFDTDTSIVTVTKELIQPILIRRRVYAASFAYFTE
ncbi:hypothetical protein IWQ60_009614 [Tieghemiomyces parasiticus]|uniref:Ribosomal RNA-processing protein 43 n=1 Tax=Tieghemiomyces parasiticus TaxID=78921 RepID=A0A9W8DKV5_9FUNG|nr:hypothetical protein IWQ60_009614 [Tieghemiomyces parasiticus]